MAKHRVMPPPPPAVRVGKAGKNHLYEEITPLLPPGIGERYSQTTSNIGHAALLRRSELPPINESVKLTQEALYLIHYSESPTDRKIRYRCNFVQSSFMTIKYLIDLSAVVYCR